MKTLKWFLLSALMAAVLTGCATSRSVVDINVTPVANPANGKPVKIVQVTDNRKFEVAPKTQSIPSISEQEINDTKITSRVIGRKRNTYGKALGDLLLPEQRTVQDLVREAVTKALRERGYSVVDERSPAYSNALPVEARIDQLWAYMTPGFWALTLDAEVTVNIKGDIFASSQQETVRGGGRMSAQAAFESNYVEVMQNAVDDFIKNLSQKLKSGY